MNDEKSSGIYMDFTKWLVDLSGSFAIELCNNMDGLFYDNEYIYGYYEDINTDSIYWKQLLIEAIAGLNKQTRTIEQRWDSIDVYAVSHFGKDPTNVCDENASQAREKALKLIHMHLLNGGRR
ncbi:MAG: hypothetical protein GY793_02045 [Proteobacteria bacterium]|nr:hypothetical protein [Pseudomonadota bacterium]